MDDESELQYGTEDTIDLGVRRVLNTDHPIRHLLLSAAHGWVITRDACNGDYSAITHYESESDARADFERLRRTHESVSTGRE